LRLLFFFFKGKPHILAYAFASVLCNFTEVKVKMIQSVAAKSNILD
jgi:hypothetical protein